MFPVLENPLEMVILPICCIINLEGVLKIEPDVFPKLVDEEGDSVFYLGENFVFPFQACVKGFLDETPSRSGGE